MNVTHQIRQELIGGRDADRRPDVSAPGQQRAQASPCSIANPRVNR